MAVAASFGISVSVFDLGDLDMQPLSRVKPTANVVFGEDDTMQQRPELAVLVAECITQFANLDSMMGLSLALILDANQKAILLCIAHSIAALHK